jgi:hypothetical protein
MKNYITNFYKKLFGAPVTNNFTLDELVIDDITQVSPEENAILTADFIEKEVYEAVMQMKNKAPRTVWFSAKFY